MRPVLLVAGVALTDSQNERLLQARLAYPDIAQACALAHTFADLVRHHRGYLLLEWIRQAEQDAPKSVKRFAGFDRQALEAVGDCLLRGLTGHCTKIISGYEKPEPVEAIR